VPNSLAKSNLPDDLFHDPHPFLCLRTSHPLIVDSFFFFTQPSSLPFYCRKSFSLFSFHSVFPPPFSLPFLPALGFSFFFLFFNAIRFFPLLSFFLQAKPSGPLFSVLLCSPFVQFHQFHLLSLLPFFLLSSTQAFGFCFFDVSFIPYTGRLSFSFPRRPPLAFCRDNFCQYSGPRFPPLMSFANRSNNRFCSSPFTQRGRFPFSPIRPFKSSIVFEKSSYAGVPIPFAPSGFSPRPEKCFLSPFSRIFLFCFISSDNLGSCVFFFLYSLFVLRPFVSRFRFLDPRLNAFSFDIKSGFTFLLIRDFFFLPKERTLLPSVPPCIISPFLPLFAPFSEKPSVSHHQIPGH